MYKMYMYIMYMYVLSYPYIYVKYKFCIIFKRNFTLHMLFQDQNERDTVGHEKNAAADYWADHLLHYDVLPDSTVVGSAGDQTQVQGQAYTLALGGTNENQ